MKRILFKRITERNPPKFALTNQLIPKTIELLEDMFGGLPVGFDFETYGLDATLPEKHVRSIGLANDRYCIAIDLEHCSAGYLGMLMKWLGRQKLIAHNLNFDAGWIYKYTGEIPTMECCTSALYKYMSTEGFLGQTWGLKDAMIEVLDWPSQNDHDLKDWLKENGLGKADMAKAPWDIIGPYNALDAAATYQMWQEMTRICKKYPWGATLLGYMKDEVINEIGLLIESQFAGLKLDLEDLGKLDIALEAAIEGYMKEFLFLPKIIEFIDELKEADTMLLSAAEPAKYLKDGVTESKRWRTWSTKMASDRPNPFNIDSPKQLVNLFYNFLEYDVKDTTPKGEPSVNKRCLPFFDQYGEILIKYRLLRDQRKFVTSLGKAQNEGRLHPRMRIPGTITGRLSGGFDAK